MQVMPAFDRAMSQTDCVGCGDFAALVDLDQIYHVLKRTAADAIVQIGYIHQFQFLFRECDWNELRYKDGFIIR